MPISAETGRSTLQDSFQASAQAAGMLYRKIGTPDLLILFASISHNPEMVMKGIQSVFKDIPLIGTSAFGEMTQEGMNENSVVIAGISSTDMGFSMGLGSGLEESTEKTGIQAAKEALKNSGNRRFKAGLFFPEMIGGYSVFNGLRKTLNDKTLLFGGCSSGNRRAQVSDRSFSEGIQYFNGEIHTHGVPLVLFDGNFEFAMGVGHGCQPLGRPAKIGKSEGNIIYEIDDISAADYYRKYLGDTGMVPYPLGFEHEGFMLLRSVAGTAQKGGLVFTTEIPTGTNVRITRGSRNNIFQSTRDTVQKVLSELKGAAPRLAVVISCISRKTMLGTRIHRELEIIQEVLGSDVPLIGGYCAGEFGPVSGVNCYHNFSFCLCVIGERDKGELHRKAPSPLPQRKNKETEIEVILYSSNDSLEQELSRDLENLGIGLCSINDLNQMQNISSVNTPRVFMLEPEDIAIAEEIRSLDDTIQVVLLCPVEERGKHAHALRKFSGVLCGICYLPCEKSELEFILNHAFENSRMAGDIKKSKAALKQAHDNIEEIESQVEITEKLVMKSYNEIEEANNYTHNIIESITDALIVTDFEGRINTVNRAALNFLECSKNSLTDRFIRDILLYGKDVKKIDHIDFSRNLNNFETTIKNPSGREIPVLLSSSVIGDKEGKTEGIVYVIKDITDRHMTLSALKESEERFRHVAQNAMEWIWEVDCKGIFTYSNSIVKEILGYSEDEIVGRFFYDFLNPKADIEQKWKSLTDAEKMGISRGVIFPFKTKNNDPVILETNFSPILNNDKASSGYRGSATDITRRIEDEQRLKEAREKAEEASIAKSRFLANMSHEIRTPMNAVLGFAELLARTELTPEQKDYLDTVKESGDLLLSLISDILDLSKIESGEIVLENIRFNLEHLAASALRIISSRMNDKPIQLRFDYEKDTPRYFIGDPTKIKQVLINLLGNAIKFTDEGYISVTISCEKRDTGNLIPENENIRKIRINVKDTGVGIPQKDRDFIFEAFTQGDASVTRKFGGSGLGLAITRAFIESMGGSIDVESREGMGTEFKFSILLEECDPFDEHELLGAALKALKYREKKDAVDTGLSIDKKPLIKSRLLLVDDNEVNLKLGKILLKKMGYLFDIAKNGQEAVELVMQNHYDLILMDLQMPVMDGIRATENIRNEMRKEMPIIAMTAASTREEIDNALGSGINDYILKPVKIDDLKDKLKKWL